jgi:selenocysteine lyase/cysteine desulfurase
MREKKMSLSPSLAKAKDAVDEAAEKVREGRREFMKLIGAGSASFAAASAGLARAANGDAATDEMSAMLGGSEKLLGASSPYASAWKFAPGLLYMQIGQTGATPKQAVDDFYANYQDIASTPQAYTFGQQGWLNAVAPGFGADPTELTFSFSTTDGLNRIMYGLEWQPGDELITSNMEESAGISVQGILADRYGVVIKQANVPTNDAYTEDEMFNRLTALKTAKTKAIMFSAIMYLTGTRLPEKRLCMWAAQNGIISIVDGAHLPGMVNIDLHDMGCDFMSGAGHKWQCGPGQTGIMYVRNGFTDKAYTRTIGGVDMPMKGYSNTTPLPKFWPVNAQNYVSGGTNALQKGARDPSQNVGVFLQSVGNGSRPSQATLAEVCQLWDKWGRSAIEDYIVSLAQFVRANIVAVWGPKVLSVPYDPTGAAHVGRTGLTAFNPFAPNFDFNADITTAQSTANATAASTAVTQIKAQNNIVIVTRNTPHTLRSNPALSANVTSGANKISSTSLRVSTHLFHSPRDVVRVVDALINLVPVP